LEGLLRAGQSSVKKRIKKPKSPAKGNNRSVRGEMEKKKKKKNEKKTTKQNKKKKGANKKSSMSTLWWGVIAIGAVSMNEQYGDQREKEPTKTQPRVEDLVQRNLWRKRKIRG